MRPVSVCPSQNTGLVDIPTCLCLPEPVYRFDRRSGGTMSSGVLVCVGVCLCSCLSLASGIVLLYQEAGGPMFTMFKTEVCLAKSLL